MVQQFAQQSATLQPGADARELFQAAYENRYTWDANFPGYTADVTFRKGDEAHHGTVRVSKTLSLELDGITDEAARKAVEGQLWETTIHRVRRAFADTHGKNTFTVGDRDETGAIEVLMGGKAEGDRYKLRNNEVCMVHRHIHGVVVTIHTSSSHQTDSGYLSHRYDSVYHDPKTGEPKGGPSQFDDNYTKIGDYYILTSREIQTETAEGTVVETYEFSNVRLLESALA